MKIKTLHIFLFCVLFNFFSIKAQTLDDAKQWFLDGKYSEALPVFMSEYNVNPKDKALNQWVGICLFETGKIIEAEPYLSFASESKIPQAYLYLGELYSLQYRFDDAEAQFEKYQKAKKKDKEALELLEGIRLKSDKLKRLTRRTEDIQIIDSIVVSKKDFLKAYHLSENSGDIMYVSNFFENQAHNSSVLHVNEKQNKVLFSQYDSINGLDLYSMEKLLDSFGNKKRLSESINNANNQAYPFVLSDGLTLYYASNDQNSLGGYDLFVTRYNLATDSYLTPNQMNMPFNSPFNDYMLAIDEVKGIGWFASDRFQSLDSVCVYTFIPSEKVILVESEEDKYLADRAKISSIKQSWKPGTNYASLIELAKKENKTVIRQTGDFVFVINDSKTYQHLSDFQSNDARQLFEKALNAETEYESKSKQLNELRDQFSSVKSSKDNLRLSILSLENDIELLYENVKRLKMASRNTENRYLF